MFFNVPYTSIESIGNIKDLIDNPTSVNEGKYLKKCKSWLEHLYPGYTAYMTTSCPRALEIISLSLNLVKDDEVILSPFTYVGVGNAFANYGAKLVFVDIDPQTMNIDARLIEAAVTPKTKAIIAMHYASIPCEMDKIRSICNQYGLALIEDNAQGIQAYSNGQLLGSFGDFSCISFDMLKNISCNEGGVLLCKNEKAEAVEIAFNNGTNKKAFSEGLVSKYEWINKGSKFSMSEYTAAVLYPLLQQSEGIIADRKRIWKSLFDKIRKKELLQAYIPEVMIESDHNAHLAYLKFIDVTQRNKVLDFLNAHNVPCSFHYIPLDASKEGKKIAQSKNVCPVSLCQSECLLRLPMHNYLTESDQHMIVTGLISALNSN